MLVTLPHVLLKGAWQHGVGGGAKNSRHSKKKLTTLSHSSAGSYDFSLSSIGCFDKLSQLPSLGQPCSCRRLLVLFLSRQHAERKESGEATGDSGAKRRRKRHQCQARAPAPRHKMIEYICCVAE